MIFSFLRTVLGDKKTAQNSVTDILIEFSESPRSEYGKKDRADQGKEQRVFSAAWGAEGSVMMDGFEGYFSGYNSETVQDVVGAFKTIGAHETAKIFEEAIKVAFTEGLPAGNEAMQEHLEKLDIISRNRLEELNQKFFQEPDAIGSLLHAYVCSHPLVFGPIRQPSNE